MSDSLEAASRRLEAARTAVEACEATVAAADRLLDADVCEFLVEETDRLVVEASSERGVHGAGGSYPLAMGIPGKAYAAGTARVIDDLRDTRGAASDRCEAPAASTEYRSLCCVPVDGHGLLLAKAKAPRAFDEADRALAGRLGAAAREALDRLAVEPSSALANGGSKRNPDGTDRLDDVADILSHDLRNPLNVAEGNLELARETGDDEHFEKTAAALERIGELVEEVVVLARTGDIVERTTTVELGDVVREAWENVETGEATLVVDGSTTLEASRRAVVHLFENLVENAVAHAGPAVTVRVGTTEDGFFLEDDGPGVPPEHRDRIFHRGYAMARGNTGLGLSIVERIVEAHGWAVSVDESPDGGARFAITGVGPDDR